MITDAIWGASYAAQAHSLHVYVARLRKKLQAAHASRRYIVTSRASATGLSRRRATNWKPSAIACNA